MKNTIKRLYKINKKTNKSTKDIYCVHSIKISYMIGQIFAFKKKLKIFKNLKSKIF